MFLMEAANIQPSMNKLLSSPTIIVELEELWHRQQKSVLKRSGFESLTHFLLQVFGLKHPLVDERLFSGILRDQTGSLRLERALERTNIFDPFIYYKNNLLLSLLLLSLEMRGFNFKSHLNHFLEFYEKKNHLR